MRWLLSWTLALLLPAGAGAYQLELLDSQVVATKNKFQKTKIGGLSAIAFDSATETLTALSDDRGQVAEPRFYEFSLKVDNHKKLVLEPQKVVFIKRQGKGILNTVLDMEGVAQLPWGNWLISSEGDNNHKPRVAPELLDVKKDGTWVRSFPFPDKFIPEKAGQQSKGIRNNRGFEALTKVPNEERYFLINEESLVQDTDQEVGPLRILSYEAPEAWIIKPSKEFIYLPEGAATPAHEALVLGGRVSEALALSATELLVLERTMAVSKQGLSYRCKIFLANLDGATDVSAMSSLKGMDLSQVKPVQKKLVLDFETLKDKLGGAIENFEGLAFGPEVDKKRTILVISDDNFKSSERTQILLLRLLD